MRNYLFERDLPPVMMSEQARKKQRKAKRRMVLSAVTFLLLISALTVSAVWFRQMEGNVLDHLDDAAGGYDDKDRFFGIYPGLYDEQTQSGTNIPKAPAGVEPLLYVTERLGDSLSAQEIYQKVRPSVVSITAYGSDFGASGSGVILSADGYILTNYHVIRGMDRAAVTLLTNGETSNARLVGYYSDMDLAVLKIEQEGLTPAEFGSSRDLEPGEAVYAIGNPMGYLYGSITDGIVSAVDRRVTIDGHSMRLIQTSAALNSGNSGGALVNAWGQVVGITVAKIDPPSEVTNEGMGLAIPISEARRCVNTLLRAGEMENPAIGIKCSDWRGGTGVLVEDVDPDSPAEEAGLLPKDVILTADGKRVDGVDALKDVIFDLGVGAEMRCTVLRGAEEMELTLKLREG